MKLPRLLSCLAASALLVFALCAQAQDAKPKQAKPPASPAQAGRPPLKTRPVGDEAIRRTIADAMGFVRGMGRNETTKTINRVQWRGSGQITEGGVTTPVTSYIYTVSLHLKAAREDFTRTVKGKPERRVRVVLDGQAWDEREPGIDELPASDTALNRRLQLARTPIGFTRAMLDADPASIKIVDPGPGGQVSLSFAIEGAPVTAVLDADYRPATITMTVDGRQVVSKYSAYRDLSEYGLMFATRATETIDGRPYLTLNINDGRVASYAVFPKPVASTAQSNN